MRIYHVYVDSAYDGHHDMYIGTDYLKARQLSEQNAHYYKGNKSYDEHLYVDVWLSGTQYPLFNTLLEMEFPAEGSVL
jgi:hypothetical protein